MGLKNLLKYKARVSAVDVDKEQKRRRTLCLVTNLKKDASASRRLEVVLTTLTALVVKTHMEKKSIKCTRLEQAQVKEKGGQLR